MSGKISEFEVFSDTLGSDHAPILCSLNVKISKKNSMEKSKEIRFNFKKADWGEYRERVNRGISELDLSSSVEVNHLNGALSNLMNYAANSSIPKYLNCCVKSYSSEVISLINERREIRRDIKKIRDLEEKKIFKAMYNRTSAKLRFLINEYTDKNWTRFLGKLGQYPTSTREFWSIINKAKQQKKSGTIPSLTFQNRVIKTDEEKANVFASILSETFTDDCTSTEFDTQIHRYVEDFVKNYDYSDPEFPKVSLAELDGVIKNLKGGSSPGEDGIQNEFLKALPSKAVEKLLDLINLSIVEGLPDAWKSASITMIPKKENKSSSPANYRPISLTSCVGKLAERVVKNRLYSFLESKNLIVKEQSGFRKKRGTADNLVSITQKIQECLNRKKKVCGIFFDISQAFDKVWQAGLLFKLICLGVPKYLTRFIKFFLENRKFKVVVNKIASIIYSIFCGVPQGSVFGPLLFLVFIGDIPLANARNFSFSALFADDLASLFIFKKVNPKLIKRIRNYLQSLVAWLFKWRLKMIASKCCYTIFSGKEYLCFDKHYANLRIRALRKLNFIKKFSHKSWHLNKKTLVSVFRALVGSIFDYSFFTYTVFS